MIEPFFRPATNKDAENVRELVFGVLSQYRLAADPDSTDRDLFDIVGSYAARGGCFEVLVYGPGEIIGSYGLYPLREGVCELRKMYLHRAHRGRGLGKAILRRALDQARKLGFRRVELETASVLQEAIALYESFGFRPFQPEHMSSRCDSAMFLDLTSETP
jgi:putative acetyltransferase